MRRFAVILSGCGHQDGAEITESVSTLISLSEAGVAYQVFAPNMEIAAKDHTSGQQSGDKRNVLKEAARIARGSVRDLKELNVDEFDGLVMPGGFGAALHFCNWAENGSKCTVLPEMEKILNAFFAAQKPIGAICIAPALVARVLGRHGITVTIGNNKEVAQEIEKTGAHHENCAVNDFVTDRQHRIVTTPAYMYDDAKPNEVFTGIRGAIRELVEMS